MSKMLLGIREYYYLYVRLLWRILRGGNRVKITEQIIPHIEKAVGFTLYEHQKDYLLDRGPLMCGRKTGKTVAYCIRLALSKGEPLSITRPEKFADEQALPNHRSYARGYFRHEFMEYRQLLADYGFPVRDVKS